jgi:nitrogen fixation/metabolism regulation signal transduction histidine kinase
VGDRLSISFIGILTVVAYQMVLGDILPRISYFTLTNGFLNLSFIIMCASVVINLRVSILDRQGKSAKGDQLDRRCRWIFPLIYFGLILVMLFVAFFLLPPV